jgi:hypothetical protein
MDSANDICLKRDGALCVIIVFKNAGSFDENKLDVLNSVGQGFASKISRGIQFNFSWIDAEIESAFAGVLGGADVADTYPRLIVLNPGKRKRFLVH